MKAIALTEYGDADVLDLRDLPDPLVGPDSVLVRVRAAGVNPVDYKIRAGYLRGAFPHHTPLIPGWDVAGEVAATGPAITDFLPGDRVFGYARKDHVQFGTYAELVAVPDRVLARIPPALTDVEAGALPLAGLTALQALRAARVHEGDTVLVHAAAGGVGHLAVQIATALGARVIGTASPANHDFVRSLGGEPVPYGDDLPAAVAAAAGGDGRVDVVIDLVGGPALAASPGLVHDPGRIVSVVDAKTVLALGGRYVFVHADAAQLTWLAELAEAGRLRVEVARVFPLAQAAAAQRMVEGGHVRGKVVLSVPD